MSMNVILLCKSCCPPCETTHFLIKKVLLSRQNINYTKITLNSTNKTNILEKYKLTENNITDYDVPIVLINDELFSKQIFKESNFVAFLDSHKI